MSNPNKPLVGVKKDRDTGEWVVVTPNPKDPSENIEHYRVIGHRLAMYRAGQLYKRMAVNNAFQAGEMPVSLHTEYPSAGGPEPAYNYHLDEEGNISATVNPQSPFKVGPNGTIIGPGHGGNSVAWNPSLKPQGGAGGRGGLQKGMAEQPKLPSLRPRIIALGIDALMLALEFAKRSQREVE